MRDGKAEFPTKASSKDGRKNRERALWHMSNVRSAWKYKCQGKVKGTYDKYIYLFMGQKYKENGMVMRYVEVGKSGH